MFTTLLAAVVLVAPAIRGVAAESSFNVNTPVFTQCADASITWDMSNYGPWNVVVLDSNDLCGTPLFDIGDHTMNHITWKVTLPAGAVVEVSVEDTQWSEGWTNTITVGPSNDTSCLSPAQLAAISSSASSTATVAKTTTTTKTGSSSSGKSTATGAAAAGNAVTGAISGASMASFSLPALALSAAVGIFALL